MTMPPKRSAFSLPELLIVISIFALLLSMTLAMVTRSRSAARSVQCRDNLRQIGIAIVDYANLHSGTLDPGWPSRPIIYDISWPYYILGDKTASLMLCPATPDPSEGFSYIMNGWIRVRNIRLGTKLHHAFPTSDVVLVGEHRVGISTLYNDIEAKGDAIDHRRHRPLGSNLLWLDYHVSADEPPHPFQADDSWSIP